MTTPAHYTEALERALGRVIAETRAESARQIELATARADAVLAKLEARNTELEARHADLERSVREQVEAGIASAVGEIEERLAERQRPHEASILSLSERVDAVEARGAEFAALAERLAEVEAREVPDAAEIARRLIAEAIAELPQPESLDPLRGEIEAVRDSIPEVPDVSGFVTREEAEAALAEVRDAIPTVPEPKDWTEEIEAVRDSIPEVPDVSGFVTREEAEEALAEIREAIPVVPEPKDWTEEIEAVRAAIPEPVEVPDVSGFATRDELDEVRSAIPTVPEPRDWSPEIEAVAERATSEAATMKESAIAALEEMRERLARHPGNFPKLRAWTDGVHYAGDVVVHDGATWQARQDTGKAPPHEDWSCIAAKGEKGDTGRSWTVRGTYSADETYQALDVVMLDGSSFVARQDDPGECPGDGWQLAASRGSRGKPGDSVKGDRGKDAEPVVSGEVSDDGLLTLTNGDGSTVDVDLYPLLARLK